MSFKAAGKHFILTRKEISGVCTEAEVTGVVGKVLELGLVSSFAVAALKVKNRVNKMEGLGKSVDELKELIKEQRRPKKKKQLFAAVNEKIDGVERRLDERIDGVVKTRLDNVEKSWIG
ncbi:7005_t:CDS:2 [Paraglomus occultum]|uniref:7005_t:CDS:1 n=1 Tax=Paraglomus occultum TaxID=144539 RepID=A0A9N9BW47_9GLOM|nr:7005_t:CDS:2 [Paraglomus occultum]